MGTTTPWSDYRPADGSPLVISFDWHDSHSNWRLEDLAGQITEAREILARHQITTDTVDYVHEIKPLVQELHGLHRNTTVDDATVRRALALADEIDLSDDIESFDANFEFECIIDHLNEVLSAWQHGVTWCFTDDEWNVDVADWFTEYGRRHRDGYGDRWKVVIDDTSVEMPDGTVITAVRDADDAMIAFFERLSEQYDDEDALIDILRNALVVDPAHRDDVIELVEAADDSGTYLNADVVREANDLVRKADPGDLPVLAEYLRSLAQSWDDLPALMFRTAWTLHRPCAA